MSWQVRRLAPGDAAASRRGVAFVAGCPAGHFHQHPGWPAVAGVAESRSAVLMAEDGETVGALAVLTVEKVGGIGPSVAHVDRGPVINDGAALAALLPELIREARRAGAVSLRVSPYVAADDQETLSRLHASGFRVARTQFGYDRTLEVDLPEQAEDLLRSFRKGHRSAVRQAQRAGVEVVEAGAAEAEVFDGFYRDMVSRKGASPLADGFFQRLHAFLESNPEAGFFSMSRLEGRDLGGLFVMRHGRRGIYAFGASPALEPGLPRTHILHFAAMLRCRRLGVTSYDLGGASAGTGEAGKRSARQNINLFKSGFTGRQRALIPEHELVLKPLRHQFVEVGRRVVGRT